MSDCVAPLNFDAEFRVPPDCLREGRVTCKVTRQRCEVLERWDDWVTVRVTLRLRIAIRSGELATAFRRTVVLTESVWLKHRTWVRGCTAKGAVCHCVVHRGRVHCHGTVRVEFDLDRCRPISLIRPDTPPPSLCNLPIIVPIPIPIPWRW